MNMTDAVKLQDLIGRKITDAKIVENKEVWLDFEDGGRMVVQVKDRGDTGVFALVLRVYLDNEIVHQHQLTNLQLRDVQKRY